jgi:hypothetical protein
VAEAIPKPEELASALMAFPPKLSVLVKPLTVPEDLFESTVKSAGIEVPPGPHKMLITLMSSLEGSMPAALPTALPPLPGLPTPSAAPQAGAPAETTAKQGFEIK